MMHVTIFGWKNGYSNSWNRFTKANDGFAFKTTGEENKIGNKKRYNKLQMWKRRPLFK